VKQWIGLNVNLDSRYKQSDVASTFDISQRVKFSFQAFFHLTLSVVFKLFRSTVHFNLITAEASVDEDDFPLTW
jgi:hypothetical protein